MLVNNFNGKMDQRNERKREGEGSCSNSSGVVVEIFHETGGFLLQGNPLRRSTHYPAHVSGRGQSSLYHSAFIPIFCGECRRREEREFSTLEYFVVWPHVLLSLGFGNGQLSVHTDFSFTAEYFHGLASPSFGVDIRFIQIRVKEYYMGMRREYR